MTNGPEFRRGRQWRFMLIAVPVILAVTVLGIAFAWESRNTEIDQKRGEMASLARSTASDVERLIAQRHQLLTTLARTPSFRSGDTERIQESIDALDAVSRGFSGGIAWIDREGLLRALSDLPATRLPVDVADRPYVRTALAGGESVQTIVGRITKLPQVTLAVPVRADGGGIIGVVSGSFLLRGFSAITPTEAPDGSKVTIVDRDGNLLVGGSQVQLEQIAVGSPYQRMRSVQNGVLDATIGVTGGADEVLGYATIPGTAWLVVLSRPRRDLVASAQSAFDREAAVLGLAGLIGIAAVVWGAVRLRRVAKEDSLREASGERLRSIAARLIAATDSSTVGATVCEGVRDEFGAPWCAVLRSQPGIQPISLSGGHGDVPEGIEALRIEPASVDATAIIGPAELKAIDPDGVLDPKSVIVVTPIGSSGHRVLLAPLRTLRSLSDLERHALSSIVDDAVQAFDRTELIERNAEVAKRNDLLNRVAVALNTVDGVERRAERLLAEIIPTFADFGSVELPQANGTVEPVAVRHSDPGLVAKLRELRVDHRTPADAPVGIAKLLRDGQSQRIASIPDQQLVLPTEEVASALAEIDAASYLGVAIRAGADIVGGLLLGRGRSREPFGEDDESLAEQLAQSSGLAIERARLAEYEQRVALELQNSLISPHPSSFAGQIVVATRYRPAERELEVGGDWFDALALPGRRVGVVVGDVVGHGLRAAATMGKMSSATRALSVDATGPVQVVERLERYASLTPGTRLTTLAFAVLDPYRDIVEFCAAGHPPPVMIGPDGAATLLWGGRSSPLGIDPDAPRTSSLVPLPPGATVVLYSDGLIERRGETLDTSLGRLVGACREFASLSPDELADALVARLLRGPRSDDVVVLIARRRPADAVTGFTFAAEAGELAGARQRLSIWLGQRTEDTGEIMLAVGEALSNAVEHAYPDGQGAVDVEMVDDGETGLVVVVTDRGNWRSPPAPGPRGRGLVIIRAIAETTDVTADHSGTTVTMRFARRGLEP